MDNQPIQSTPPLPSPSNSSKTFLLVAGAIALMIISAVGGYYLGENRQQPSQPFPTPTATPTPMSDETANWKTYINTQDGYSLKYPSDYDLKDKDSVNNFVRISPKVKPCNTNLYPNNCEVAQEIAISVKNNPKDLIIEKFADPNNTWDMKFTTIMVNNNEAKRSSDRVGQTHNEDVYIKRGDKIFHLDLIKGAGKEIPLNIFDQILSTFKFTNQ